MLASCVMYASPARLADLIEPKLTLSAGETQVLLEFIRAVDNLIKSVRDTTEPDEARTRFMCAMAATAREKLSGRVAADS